MSPDTAAILEEIHAALPAARLSLLTNPGPSAQHSLLVANESLVDVLRVLRDKLDFDLLSNVTGVDWPSGRDLWSLQSGGDLRSPQSGGDLRSPQNSESGFLETLYHLYSTNKRLGPLVLRARTADRTENAKIPSAVSIFRSAEFQEREIFDLYGITFTNHPDLRRILMWDEFIDHPMRKDYTAPDDYEYEPTPHDDVLAKAKAHYPQEQNEPRINADAHGL